MLEVAIGSVDDAAVAQANGADRLELSSALSLGGLTQSLGMIESVRRASSLPLMVLIRPRPAGFCYSDAEFATMCRDAEIAIGAGADGIVFGILTADGNVDQSRCRAMKKLTGDRAAVFHRAFDVVPNPFIAVEQIIDMGFQRILTSGQTVSALEGSSLIGKLIEQGSGRIDILPGGGIRPENVRAIVDATRCVQVHGSFRHIELDTSTQIRPPLRFGSNSSAGEHPFDVTDGEAVRAVRAILDEIENPLMQG
jgi:copper homeostasis protein